MTYPINFISSLKKNSLCNAFIIAEAGVHHGGSLDTAKKLIDAAASAGADAVKFQTYKSETLVTSWAPKYWQDDKEDETQFEYFKKRDIFGFSEYQELSNHAAEQGIIFSSTPFDVHSVEWLSQLEMPFYKVASADIENFPLLEKIAQTSRPILLSTGASYFEEIDKTVKFLKSQKVSDIALLHCNLSYPTPNHHANLNRIIELKKRFPDLVVGYSDHTVPDSELTIPSIAAALGAEIIEKHFTTDRTIPGDDHYHSCDPDLLKKMIQRIALAEIVTNPYIEITESELPARQYARRSVVAGFDIPAGTILTKNMLIPKRPGGGISPSEIAQLLGRRTKTYIQKDQQLTWEMLEDIQEGEKL